MLGAWLKEHRRARLSKPWSRRPQGDHPDVPHGFIDCALGTNEDDDCEFGVSANDRRTKRCARHIDHQSLNRRPFAGSEPVCGHALMSTPTPAKAKTGQALRETGEGKQLHAIRGINKHKQLLTKSTLCLVYLIESSQRKPMNLAWFFIFEISIYHGIHVFT